jgi:cytochrome c oxidase cbb3-type subunit 4
MDINDFRGLMTAVTMFAFLGICAWAWSRKRKQDFKAMAGLPLEEDQPLANDTEEKS